MGKSLHFRQFEEQDKARCLEIFDANCPEYFASNERKDYEDFLACGFPEYEVCLMGRRVVGAFGVFEESAGGNRRLHWILLAPESQGIGLGRGIMDRSIAVAQASGAQTLLIAASHKSAPFFAKFGALVVESVENGWGIGMHRVNMELPLCRNQSESC